MDSPISSTPSLVSSSTPSRLQSHRGQVSGLPALTHMKISKTNLIPLSRLFHFSYRIANTPDKLNLWPT